VKEEDGMEGVIESSSSVAAATAPTQNNLSELLASPSKQLMPTIAKNAEGTSTVELRRSVPYNDFLKMGQEIGGLAVSSCTLTQHAIYSHLQAIKNLLTIGDYNHERHAGTSVEGLSMLLAVVAKDRTPAGEDQPKARVVPKRGRKPTQRLGSENSTVSAKKPRSCRFCKKQGCQTNSCNTKNEWGESISISNSTLSQIAQKLEQIAEGKHADFRDMSTVMELDRIGTKIVDAIPKGTKRLQVKGYLRYQENQYLFCTCINSEGEIHTRSEGSQLISYADVFIKKSAVVVSFSNMMDHIFWKPSVGGNEVV
jgi:RNA polymerase subunit RPABC4/transcription elongation factor Spt4